MTFAVVTWKSKGSTPLPVEEVEVINLQKLVIDGEAAKGSNCSMQYHQQMWHGEIHSLHGKLKSAVFLNFVAENKLHDFSYSGFCNTIESIRTKPYIY